MAAGIPAERDVKPEMPNPSWAVHSQLQSPLFSGLLPAEIRTQILEEAVGLVWARPPTNLEHDFMVAPHHEYRQEEDDAAAISKRVALEKRLLGPIFSSAAPNPPLVEESESGLLDFEQSLSHIKYHFDTNKNDWRRPDFFEPADLYGHSAFLVMGTCRRIYIEAIAIFARINEANLWFHRFPPRGKLSPDYQHYFTPRPSRRYRPQRGMYMEEQTGTAPWWCPAVDTSLVRRMRRARVFAQMFWLEQQALRPGYFVPTIGAQPRHDWALGRIEDLRLTIRRGDWWNNEVNNRLQILPFGSHVKHFGVAASELAPEFDDEAWEKWQLENRYVDLAEAAMTTTTATTTTTWFPPCKLKPRAWGALFAHMPALRSLTMDLETSEDKRDEAERIVRWALRDWRFPLDPTTHVDGCHYLDTRGVRIGGGEQPKRSSWRGLRTHWSGRCTACNAARDASRSSARDGCTECRRFWNLYSRDLGPRIFTWTLRWTARKWEKEGPAWPYGEELFEGGWWKNENC